MYFDVLCSAGLNTEYTHSHTLLYRARNPIAASQTLYLAVLSLQVVSQSGIPK